MTYKTKKFKLDNISESFKTIVGERSPFKNAFMHHWSLIYKDYYGSFNQYGHCKENGNQGVLDENGKWSYLNLFNTNYSVNTHLCGYINKRIRNELISKGIRQLDDLLVNPVSFENNGFDSESKFLEKEMEKYFTWVRFFGDDIFLPHGQIKDGTILRELINISKTTFHNGTYCEVVLQYYIMKWDPNVIAHRTSIVRGSSEDFSGRDIYTTDLTGKVLNEYQSKLTGIYKNSIKKLDNRRYQQSGVHFMGLVDLFSGFKRRVVILNLVPDLFFTNQEGKYEFTDDKIYKKTVMSNFFAPDSAFYNFFLYCSKKDIVFDLEKNDESEMDVQYDSKENKVIAILPSDEDKLDNIMILTLWGEMIDALDTGEVRNNNMEELKKFVK